MGKSVIAGSLAVFILILLAPNLAEARGHRWHRNDERPVQTPPVVQPNPVPNPVPATSGLVLGAFNANVGTIDVYFVGWKDSPKSCSTKTQFVYWEQYGVTLDSIINGSQDSVINSFAAKLCPGSYLSVMHEFNLVENPWGGNPTKFKAAWKRIHDLVGSKATHVWVANNWTTPGTPAITDYWPGNDQVDLIGLDAFSWNGESFSSIIEPTLTILKGWGKPIWITSTGTGQNNQGKWITDALSVSKQKGITGFLYFSLADGTDFKLNAEGLAALK